MPSLPFDDDANEANCALHWFVTSLSVFHSQGYGLGKLALGLALALSLELVIVSSSM